jgi:hypothetical protein
VCAQVDRAQIGERKALQCRSDCTGKLALKDDGTVDGEKACPVELLLEVKARVRVPAKQRSSCMCAYLEGAAQRVVTHKRAHRRMGSSMGAWVWV